MTTRWLRTTKGMLVGLLALLATTVRAQPSGSPRTLADTTWQRLTGAPAYSYRNLVEATPAPQPQRPAPLFEGMLAFLQFLSSPAGQVVLWSIFGAVVLYGVYQFVKNGGKFRRQDSRASATAEPLPDADDAPDADWSNLAQRAAAAGDYRTATRYGYRLLLQRLETAGLIQTEAHQSDAAVRRHLNTTPYGRPFGELQRGYERVWFGTHPADAGSYAAFQTALQKLLYSLPA